MYYPYFTLELSEDGSGWCETEDEYFEFTWYCESDGTVTLESERYHYLTPYVEHMDGFDRLWFMMQMDETVIWIY